MNICIFTDPSCTALADYHAGDVQALLESRGIKYSVIGMSGLITLRRAEADILILPYVEGEFSPKALDSLLQFHAAGGSLLFLGDLPHRERWYPYRNMHASRLHLTRATDPVNIAGLTEHGRAILETVEDQEFFLGRSLAGLRITAFPPDIDYPLFAVNSHSHTDKCRSVVCVERKGERFFGARMAVVGFIGGEPRENTCGAYQREWTYDPGLLTRKWKGIGDRKSVV